MVLFGGSKGTIGQDHTEGFQPSNIKIWKDLRQVGHVCEDDSVEKKSIG